MFKKILEKHIIERTIILLIGLYIMSLGIAFSIKASLGTSPISSVPYVTSCISGLSVGETTIIINLVFILAQILLLRKKYNPFQLFQIPALVLFGIMIDISGSLIKDITYSNYFQQWVLCFIGIILVGVGVSIEIMAKLVTTPGEGVVLAICKVFPLKFGNTKIMFDVVLVLISLITVLAFLGHLEGVREGTIIAAILVGFIAKHLSKPLKLLENKYLLNE
ncbi:hypothetical protein A966_08219 [Brachyspira hampsonii 30446]|uniref:Integral membrane protein n=1 Tax=Brachyspira hampsonii 30446 TaxID=1289135 RepID=A0A2U4F1G7_9SPIR|nr:DUF6198 family protein [Brachyspira hampsonii]EKV57009.1 hypothetical protein A966_08219 [Brachyspira hampsonii 30446]MBW5393606.1 YitT family protein [Brachyspira hampsonii]OEJ20152.1 hypothetical protein A9495_02205 [Brachyspira hampsonii]